MMHEYVATHQDRSKNALLKSIEATYLAWVEDLKADQAMFISDNILYPGLKSKPNQLMFWIKTQQISSSFLCIFDTILETKS